MKLIQNDEIYMGITTCMTALSSMWVPALSKISPLNAMKMNFSLIPLNEIIREHEVFQRVAEENRQRQAAAATPDRGNLQTSTPGRGNVRTFEDFLASPTLGGVLLHPLNRTVDRTPEPRNSPGDDISERGQLSHNTTPGHDTSERSQQSRRTSGHTSEQSQHSHHTPSGGNASAFEEFLAHPTPAGIVVQPLNESFERSHNTPAHDTSERRQHSRHTPGHDTGERSQQSHFTPGHDTSERRQQSRHTPGHTPRRGNASAFEEFLAHPTPAGVVVQPLNETAERSRHTPAQDAGERSRQSRPTPGHDTSERRQQSRHTPGRDTGERNQHPHHTPSGGNASAFEEFLAHPTPAGVVVQPLNETVERSRHTPAHGTSERRHQSRTTPIHDTGERSQPAHDTGDRSQQLRNTPSGGYTLEYEEFLAIVQQPSNDTVDGSQQSPNSLSVKDELPSYEGFADRLTTIGITLGEALKRTAQSQVALRQLSRHDPGHDTNEQRQQSRHSPIRRPIGKDSLYQETPERGAKKHDLLRTKKRLIPLLESEPPDSPVNHPTRKKLKCRRRIVAPPVEASPLTLNAEIDGESFYVTAVLPDLSP